MVLQDKVAAHTLMARVFFYPFCSYRLKYHFSVSSTPHLSAYQGGDLFCWDTADTRQWCHGEHGDWTDSQSLKACGADLQWKQNKAQVETLLQQSRYQNLSLGFQIKNLHVRGWLIFFSMPVTSQSPSMIHIAPWFSITFRVTYLLNHRQPWSFSVLDISQCCPHLRS